MKKLTRSTEFYIFLVFIALTIFIEIQSGQFFTSNNIVDMLRAMIVPGIFSIGVLMVLVSGGIDISFTAIALLSMYSATKILMIWNYEGNVIMAFIISGAIGLLLGLINASLIAFYNLPTIIVTLGTSSMFIGFMQGILHSRVISDIPKPMLEFSRAELFRVYNKELGVSSGLPVVFLILVALIIIAWFILRYTMLGRGIYALGGDRTAAERAGFNIIAIQFFIYSFVGLISGIAGMTRAIMMANVHPTNLMGMELTVIAAVVLGGTSITGGRGTITGTLLGVALITVLSNSLILMGIPTTWQKVFTGALIIIGTGLSAYQTMKEKNKVHGGMKLGKKGSKETQKNTTGSSAI
ncbi:MAG: simple sugar transport system permease protein [Halanaerobiales bacterium]|nr:simple sugar transport system permease protein [Halanaerobiales bacterium]